MAAKRVSESYIVQFLLESTMSAAAPLVWQQDESGAYRSAVSGVRLELAREHGSAGSRIFLALGRGAEKVYITEPRRTLRGRYADGDAQQLAELLKQLEQAAGRQCLERENRPPEAQAKIRNAIYRQILFQEQAE